MTRNKTIVMIEVAIGKDVSNGLPMISAPAREAPDSVSSGITKGNGVNKIIFWEICAKMPRINC